MPALELEFEVFCERCGRGLCNNCVEGTTPTRGMPFISVDPCEDCIAKAEEVAEEYGYDAGYKDGIKETDNG